MPDNSSTIREAGEWHARHEPISALLPDDGQPRVFVESDDFAHDVRLYVSGDFKDDEQRLAYANEIARRLNAWESQNG